MIIAISGANGFIGNQLSMTFHSMRYEVRILPRINEESNSFEIANLLSGVDVVINLAGAPIIGRWTKQYKEIIYDSRINTTRKIVEAIILMQQKPGLLISASAIGIYSQQGVQTETNFQLADDYLGTICTAWESEAEKANAVTRVAIIRLGIVLGKGGGALLRMLPLFRFGLGGKIATGRQGFSWIHITDLVRAVQFIIENNKLSGKFNFTAPEVVDNRRFTQVLAGILKRPAFFGVPSFVLKLIFGEGAIAVTGGQFAPPEHLTSEGFEFRFPDLKSALEDVCK